MQNHRIALLAAAIASVQPAAAGCIGPVIMGECQGQTVPWDTHQSQYQEPRPAPPGFYWDKRGVPFDQQQPGSVDPVTGRDANDSDWFRDPNRQ